MFGVDSAVVGWLVGLAVVGACVGVTPLHMSLLWQRGSTKWKEKQSKSAKKVRAHLTPIFSLK